MKTCFKCGVPKDLNEFYRHPATKDGHLGKCKACTRSDSTIHRQANLKCIREYDRVRGNRQPDGYLKKYREDNPEKYKAHNALNNAVRDGKVIKPAQCERCKSVGILHGHHDDYSKPLQVIWLCPVCHHGDIL